jgi:hypothetical protein
MTAGEWAIRGTVWLAMAGYFAGVYGLLRPRSRTTRWVWAGACELYFCHIIAAFHFAHDWNHAAAVASVSEASEALIGRPFGAGIWFNYALLIVWAFDAAWLWLGDRSYFRRPKALSYAIHGFIFFMMINGAIVFAPNYVRWPSVAACGLLGWAWFAGPTRAQR